MNSKTWSKILDHADINDFISHYPAPQRPEVIKICLLSTIYSIKSSKKPVPSLEELKDIISNAGKILSLEGVILGMKSKLESLKQEIGAVESNLNKPPPQVLIQEEQKIENNERASRSHSAPHITKAPSNWRKGDENIFRNGYAQTKPNNTKNILFRNVSPPTLRDHNYKEILKSNDLYDIKEPNASNIYPEWWVALTELDVKPSKLTNKVTQHIPPKPALKYDRKQWPEPYTWQKDTETDFKPPNLKRNTRAQLKFSPKTSEKSAEANFESIDSAVPEARVHFSDKKYSGWVGDFSKVVKNSSSKPVQSISKEISYTDSSRKDYSSGYTSSSMTNYAPNSEMKQFYQKEFNKFFESKPGESFNSARIKSPNQYSYSSEDHNHI